MPTIKPVEASHPIVPSERVKYPSPYNPYNPYYDDSIDESVKMASTSSSSLLTKKDDSKQVGWSPVDTLAPAPVIDNFTQIGNLPSGVIDPQPLSEAVLTVSTEDVNFETAQIILDQAYAQLPTNLQVSADREIAAAVLKLEGKSEAIKSNKVEYHIEVLSRKIDEALTLEGMNYEQLHALILKYCMLYMRKLSKDDQESISKFQEQILIKAGQIKDSYNTWPVVTLTLVSSGVSVIAGLGGFSILVFPGNHIAMTVATNAQNMASLSTGISGLTSIAEKQKESGRTLDQLGQRRLQDKEDEKKTAKQGNSENKKRFHSEIQETDRNKAALVRTLLGG